MREDEELLYGLLSNFKGDDQVKLKWALGYMNLQERFRTLLKENPNFITDIITASPKANGFYGAGFAKKQIPKLYRKEE